MSKCLVSVDSDYFMYTKERFWGSYIENKSSLVDLWYKRYLMEKSKGRDIKEFYRLSPDWKTFWDNIKKRFSFAEDVSAFVSDSHALSYDIAKEYGCRTVCLFDSHADLGYGGLSSLCFEVNCSNWLGMLLGDRQIEEAYIFYSPYTAEKPEDFRQINGMFNIKYCSIDDFGNNFTVSDVHVCRSGAWTPPWYDEKFAEFTDAMGFTYKTVDCPARDWEPENLDYSQQINYLLA